MQVDKLKSDLAVLERKLKILIGEHNSMRDEVNFLKVENSQLRTVIKEKDEQIGNFHNKIKITKIADSIDAGEQDAAELKKKLDDYIKEIDKCILHFSK
jgi:regulator of replication initiation timing